MAQIADTRVAAVTIDTGLSKVTLDGKILDTIKEGLTGEASTAEVSVSVARVDTQEVLSQYSDEVKYDIAERIGDRPVYDFTITAGSKTISDFKGGAVSINVPYTPKQGEDTDAVVIYYIQTTAATGTNNIDLEYTQKKSITVTNVAG